jgi:hypothetical protein
LSGLAVIPDYLASLVQLPEKNWPDKRWAARSREGGDLGYGRTPKEAVESMSQARNGRRLMVDVEKTRRRAGM